MIKSLLSVFLSFVFIAANNFYHFKYIRFVFISYHRINWKKCHVLIGVLWLLLFVFFNKWKEEGAAAEILP